MAIARFLDRMCLALRACGLWLRYATLQNLIPSFPWIAPPRPPPWCNPRKGRDQILPSGKLELDRAAAVALAMIKARGTNDARVEGRDDGIHTVGLHACASAGCSATHERDCVYVQVIVTISVFYYLCICKLYICQIRF